MYTTNLRVWDYVNNRDVNVSINASYVTITDNHTGDILYKRSIEMDEWYDDTHLPIVNALNALQVAIVSAVQAKG